MNLPQAEWNGNLMEGYSLMQWSDTWQKNEFYCSGARNACSALGVPVRCDTDHSSLRWSNGCHITTHSALVLSNTWLGTLSAISAL